MKLHYAIVSAVLHPPAQEDPDTPAADNAPDPSVLRAERRLRLLAELAEIGMELARSLRPGALADAACEPTADGDTTTETGRGRGRDPAEAFAPLSRAIRLTLALEAKTDAELRDLKAGIVRAREEQRTVAAQRRNIAADEDALAREEKIRDLVIEAAEAEIEDRGAMLELYDALEERLDEDVAYVDRAERPLRDIVERLCGDLALRPDWSLWDGEGWVRTEPPARPRFSPFNQPSARPFGPGTPGAAQAPPQRLQPARNLE
jgi:hypothetical protein